MAVIITFSGQHSANKCYSFTKQNIYDKNKSTKSKTNQKSIELKKISTKLRKPYLQGFGSWEGEGQGLWAGWQ